MKYRKLRIAWSLGCGILCLTLLTLWVRSYWWADAIWYRPTSAIAFRVMSDEGGFTFLSAERMQLGTMGDPPPLGWSHRQYWHHGYASDTADAAPLFRAFRGFHSAIRATWQIPHWLPVLALCTALGITTSVRHLQFRFGLRSLLIATALVAVGLGLVVYTVRS
jgi:hypothetical protein